MEILAWIKDHWMQIGFGWLAVQTFLKGVQDAIDAEPTEIKQKPFARIAYYMQAVSGYIFAGNRAVKLSVVILFFMIMFQGISRADVSMPDILSQIKWDAGIAVNTKTGLIQNTETIELVHFKGFALNAGYGTADAFLIGLSYDNLPKLADFGVTIPLLNQLTFQPTVYYAKARVNGSDWNTGKESCNVGAKLINLKF